jgi:hypothetical protein
METRSPGKLSVAAICTRGSGIPSELDFGVDSPTLVSLVDEFPSLDFVWSAPSRSFPVINCDASRHVGKVKLLRPLTLFAIESGCAATGAAFAFPPTAVALARIPVPFELFDTG